MLPVLMKPERRLPEPRWMLEGYIFDEEREHERTGEQVDGLPLSEA
jgi:hypothetical protein